jgi:hypothetical protein
LIRALSLLTVACWAGVVLLLITDASGNAGYVLLLILIAVVLSLFLTARAAYHRARNFVSDARAFISGDIQQARLVSVGEPRGWFTPSSEVTVELEGENGKVHSFSHDVPVAFPFAWSYRLGKRFKLPILRNLDPTAVMASELRREGLKLTVARPVPQAP